MGGHGLPVQGALYRHRPVLADGELTTPVRGPVYGVRHLAVAAPIRIRGAEFFQSCEEMRKFKNQLSKQHKLLPSLKALANKFLLFNF